MLKGLNYYFALHDPFMCYVQNDLVLYSNKLQPDLANFIFCDNFVNIYIYRLEALCSFLMVYSSQSIVVCSFIQSSRSPMNIYIYISMLFERTKSKKCTEAYLNGMERLYRPCYQRSHKTLHCRLKTCSWFTSFVSECIVAYCCIKKGRNKTVDEDPIEIKSGKFGSGKIERELMCKKIRSKI